jgi:hypothetical protein
MVVVYLRNGEKAPLPDANYVRIEPGQDGHTMLRCFFGQSEVGLFKWDEVAGYSIAAVPNPDAPVSYQPWLDRVQQA